MNEGKGRNICINMRLAQEDLARLELEKERTQSTTSTVISSAIERGFTLTSSARVKRGEK
jgi:predicted DNA-binding protein